MAEKNRRGEDAADDGLDEVFDDEPSGDEADEAAFDDDELVDDATGEPVASRGGTATRERARTDAEGRPIKTARKESGRGGLFGWIGRFFREVVAELRKVIWPTRQELLTYTGVVIVFVTVMVAIVVGLDYAFAKVVLLVFGHSK